jgi:hypothetical protein
MNSPEGRRPDAPNRWAEPYAHRLMPFDIDLSPVALLATWAAGIAAATAAVAWWRVVGAGYLWVAVGTALLTGVWSAATVGGAIGLAALVLALVLARRPQLAAPALAVGSVAFAVQAMTAVDPLLVVTGAVALGGTTCEMLLGHWYLVDPTLPRWALRRLDAVGIVGLVADTLAIVVLGAFSVGGLLPVTFVVLAGLSILMMVGVWFSLKERGYEGVMAATGLSYLTVLTALGSVALGRILLAM